MGRIFINSYLQSFIFSTSISPMKLTITASAITALTFFCLPDPVAGDRVIRFLLNNGVPLPNGHVCNASDIGFIEAIFNPSQRRNLHYESISGSLRGSSNNHTQRELTYYPPTCKRNCAGFTTGYCQATNCKGYRHDRLLAYDTEDRSLATCDEDIMSIHQQLDNLISSNVTSSECNDLLSAPRNATCYDDVIFGEVQGFTIWKSADVDSIIRTNAPNGTSVCRSISVNIEAVVNGCVDMVKFLLTGPNHYSYTQNEYKVPYTLFGDYNNNIAGRTLEVGNYTLIVTPDNISTKKKTLTFQIANC